MCETPSVTSDPPSPATPVKAALRQPTLRRPRKARSVASKRAHHVLPLVLWLQRDEVDFDRLGREATRRDERHALGYFLELAGQLGGESRLVEAARGLRDRRRKTVRMFFTGPHGSRALGETRTNTPKEALRWGYLMNMGVDSFRSLFERFARP